MKYVTYETGIFDIYVLFSDHIKHSDMINNLNVKQELILGAGFVSVIDNKIQCYGRSISLGVNSRGNLDNDLIERDI